MLYVSVDTNPKMLRETICLLSTGINNSVHSDRLEQLIAELDRQRPLGPDGKHGGRHTSTCGCLDKV